MHTPFRRFMKTLGPGILFATTCVGVSHLVQSTRAGAVYGFTLFGAIIIANIFKYPFFEFASRYTSATGVSIIDGYYKKSKLILWIYLILTVATMFIVTAAVTFVTAGLLSNLFSINLPTNIWTAIVLVVCTSILVIGKFNLLDSLLKVVGAVLVISTLAALISALYHGRPEPVSNFISTEIMEPSGIIFVIALMGWMPTAVDMSTWTSLWTEERIKQTGYHPTLKESLLDFNIGYIVSAVLALCFLTLGAIVIYGTGTELSNSSPGFAHQLISMYTVSIGGWSYYIIAISAFSTMFSTSITVMDGYNRSITRAIKLLAGDRHSDSRHIFIISNLVLGLGAFFVVSQYLNNLKSLVDFATILSFVVAPVVGLINYKMVFSKDIDPKFKPPTWLKSLAIGGLIFLIGFTLLYFYILFKPTA